MRELLYDVETGLSVDRDVHAFHNVFFLLWCQITRDVRSVTTSGRKKRGREREGERSHNNNREAKWRYQRFDDSKYGINRVMLRYIGIKFANIPINYRGMFKRFDETVERRAIADRNRRRATLEFDRTLAFLESIPFEFSRF